MPHMACMAENRKRKKEEEIMRQMKVRK